MDPMTDVWIIILTSEHDEVHVVEAHVSKESAEAAANTMDIHESYTLDIKMLQLKSTIDIDSPPKASSKSKRARIAKSTEAMNTEAKNTDTEDEEDESDEGDMAKDIRASRQTMPDIPDAIPDALNGLTLLFTGIMEKNRKTNQFTAMKYGALMTSNVKMADFVVLGAKPGAKKLEEINKYGAETITEKQFFDMIKNGVPKEKRERVAAKADEERPKKKQKK